MKINTFMDNYRGAFGDAVELPIVFWYSDTPVATTEKINGCFFKGFKDVRTGKPISLSVDTIGCGGGKLYTGFTDMPEMVPNFVSLKEKYKKTPEMVIDFIKELDIPRTEKKQLNFARIDQVNNLDAVEGILFLATPDVLSGLTTWAYYDNNTDNAVTALFGSGCSAVVTRAVLENKNKGSATFIGGFDPSVRPHLDANTLTFVIPMSRFKVMYHTMRDSCLFDTHAWSKLRERINE